MNIPYPPTPLPWISMKDDKPRQYGRYFVCRQKAAKMHYETWNGTGWAYDHNAVTHWVPDFEFPKQTLPSGDKK